ncbi:MAG: division/cell wall cluster transcriptional repressor MraZ [Desulfobacterales bacterium]|nr:division/cell wall cluster transcriptional repressor MraZ [Desulfobacterales bacterium]
MFRGLSFHTLDDKNRIIIPSRFRGLISDGGDGIMLTRHEGCLYGYTYHEWDKVEMKFLALSSKSDSLRLFIKIFIGSATQCDCDKHGRILIPPGLKEYALLQKEVVVVGVLDHFEIWSKERWQQKELQLEEELRKEDIRNEIAKLFM